MCTKHSCSTRHAFLTRRNSCSSLLIPSRISVLIRGKYHSSISIGHHIKVTTKIMKNYYYCLLLLHRLVQVANKGQMHIIPKYGESGIVPNINMSRETRYSKSKLKLKEITIELKLNRKAPTHYSS